MGSFFYNIVIFYTLFFLHHIHQPHLPSNLYITLCGGFATEKTLVVYGLKSLIADHGPECMSSERYFAPNGEQQMESNHHHYHHHGRKFSCLKEMDSVTLPNNTAFYCQSSPSTVSASLSLDQQQ